MTGKINQDNVNIGGGESDTFKEIFFINIKHSNIRYHKYEDN